mmetsp:Transcript_13747/g.22534  ORF Transcript_13747/g.22534 Transcript_13747/m.22534 type:complete len:89 (+) Transcript_13747:354-620(+)
MQVCSSDLFVGMIRKEESVSMEGAVRQITSWRLQHLGGVSHKSGTKHCVQGARVEKCMCRRMTSLIQVLLIYCDLNTKSKWSTTLPRE